MNDVNWWLMALAFVLGLALTLAFMIRRVTREVPVYGAAGRGGSASAANMKAKAPEADLPKAPKADLPKADLPKTGGVDTGVAAAAAGGAAGGAAAAKLVGTGSGSGSSDVETPYGEGSVRLAKASADGPSGYTIKGNEDSMLYHTTDSPSYRATIAEVWFREELVAERAGFTRWDKGRAGGTGTAATFADVPAGPHGPGSAKPGAGGSGPEGWAIKGNEDSKLYHSPESPSYQVTIAEVWFRDAETAEAAGFNRWDSGKSQRGKT